MRVIGQMIDDGKRLPSIVLLHQGKVRITGRARICLRIPGGGMPASATSAKLPVASYSSPGGAGCFG